jgi:CheY-like chemotaxis protein
LAEENKQRNLEAMMRRVILAMLLSAFAAFLFPAIALGQSRENPEKVSLQLQWKHQFEFAGFYFPGDLKGKTVMGEKHELESANFAQMFRQFNMSTDDLTIVPHTFSIDKFTRHEVDAMTVFLTNEVYHLRKAKVPFNIIDPNNYGVPFYDVNLFTSESFVNENPETVTAFSEASNKGWKYALDNPEEIVDLILAKYNTQKKAREDLLFEADKTQRMVQPDIYPIGSIDPVRVLKIQELFVSEGVAQTIAAPEDFIFGLRRQERIDLTPAEQDFIQKHPTLKVIKSFHQPPFIIHKGNTVTGYLHELMVEALNLAGLKARYVSGGKTYDAMVETIQNGEADLLLNMNSTRKLSNKAVRTHSVVTTPNAVVGKITAPEIESVSDLFDLKVAVAKGYAQDQHLSRFPQIQKVHVSNNDEGFDAVRMGRADYFLNNLANSSYIIQQSFATDLRVSGELPYENFPPLSLSFAASRKYADLETILRKSLVAIPMETRIRLRKRWLGEAGEQGKRIGFVLSEKERNYLARKGPLRMCTAPEWPPIEWIDENSRHQGISAEFMSSIAQRIGHGFELVPAGTWEETIENLQSGKCDFISTIPKTDEQIEAGRIVLTPETFDLHRLLLSLEEMFRLRARQNGLSLSIIRADDVPRYFHADHRKLRQILINLLGNAVKFTESGEVTLTVTRVGPHVKGSSRECILRFEVIDTGPGIAKEEQEKIFDTFFQADRWQSSHQGTGLGLPISRKFVSLMGGKLSVTSSVGMGTCFSFDLSARCTDREKMAVSRYTSRVVALEAEQQAYRVLVAEDNQNNRSLMVTLLKTVGFEVQEAVNGREAVEQWREWKPHLIWMDMRMPIMDGYEATTQIKASPGGKDSVIIALTANAFEEDRIKVIEHGCDDFVRKPYRASEIFEMINKHLGVHYIYAEDDGCLASGNSGDEVPDARLITFIKDLPEGVIVRLKEATELSDAAMIDEVIEEIRTDNVQLAEALSALAENFAYDEILALADGSRSF